MGLEKILPYYKKFQNCLAKNYPAWSDLKNLSFSEKIDKTISFSIFKKLNKSVKRMEKAKIDCTDLKKQIETAQEHSGKQRRIDVHNVQLTLATKELEHAQTKKRKFGCYLAKADIRNLKHPIIKQIKGFAIGFAFGILINKNKIKEATKTDDNISIIKKSALIGLTFAMLPKLFKPLKSFRKLSTMLIGSKLPLAAPILSIGIALTMGICIFSKIKNYLSGKILKNDETEETQTSYLKSNDDEISSLSYEC